MHTRLGEDAQIGKLLQELTRESCPFTIGNDGIKSPQGQRRSEWCGEDVDFGTLAQSGRCRLAVVRIVNIVQNRDSHGHSGCSLLSATNSGVIAFRHATRTVLPKG